jgi:hypothetical protein
MAAYTKPRQVEKRRLRVCGDSGVPPAGEIDAFPHITKQRPASRASPAKPQHRHRRST